MIMGNNEKVLVIIVIYITRFLPEKDFGRYSIALEG